MIFLLLLLTPLIGVIVEGDSILSFIKFPPKTEFVKHEGFSSLAFYSILAIAIIISGPFIYKIIKSQRNNYAEKVDLKMFPRWGWFGVFLLFGGWVVAWTRFEWASDIQIFTFTPLWLGYIIMINAFTFMRTGASLITHSFKYLLLLFLFSAVFWWYYEYLNQFTNNWYYVGIDHLSDINYFIYATIPFSTVLPAVISTWFFLRTFPQISIGLESYSPLKVVGNKNFWWLILLISSLALSATYVYPQYLFPFMWLSPLLIIAAIIAISGGKTIINSIENGNWKDLYLLAVAALICGFLWEMWNYYSLIRWEYSIPFVHRYLIFEMPVLGYLGYLPFGIQCGLIGIYISKLTRTSMIFYTDHLN